MNNNKTVIKSYYHAVKTKLGNWGVFARAKIAMWTVPIAYRGEILFFEKIRSRSYGDNEYLTKKIRTMAHFVDKIFTLSKKNSRAGAVVKVAEMVENLNQERESDKIACQWAREIVSCYGNPHASFINRDIIIPRDAGGVLSSIIKTRRSIRSYTGQKIEEDVLGKILESGLWAPSGCNRQPIEYLVVDDLKDVLLCQKYAGEPACFPQEAAVNVVVLVCTKFFY